MGKVEKLMRKGERQFSGNQEENRFKRKEWKLRNARRDMEEKEELKEGGEEELLKKSKKRVESMKMKKKQRGG